MSYFNSDQQGHMRYLATLTTEEKCLCGWERLGHCLKPSCVKHQEERKEQCPQQKTD